MPTTAATPEALRAMTNDVLNAQRFVTAYAATSEGGAVQAWTCQGSDGWDALQFAEQERGGRPLFPVSLDAVKLWTERTGRAYRGNVAVKVEGGWLLTTLTEERR